MKLVNSKIYDTYEAMFKGECMLCGVRLTFVPDEDDYISTCCDFEYKLEKVKETTECQVHVCACVGE